jgi:hypothetical protein
MGKSRRLKEWDEVQKLKEEVKKLRRENSKLRKVVSNVDMERYSFVQDLLVSLDYEENNQLKKVEKSLEQKWKCHDCTTGLLRLIILFKAGEEFYFRKCDCCNKRTKLKKYTEGVQGLK